MPNPLTDCAIDTERHIARSGWDQPIRLFAVARNADLIEREPAIAAQLGAADPEAYSTIEQEGLLPTRSIDDLLARIAWPDDVDGAVVSVERLVVPPGAERDLPADPDQATAALAAHPDRQDVRLVVAVLREGQSVCLLRQRAHDTDDKVAIGNDIAPGLVEALRATFE
nr:PPA1309 family protein [Demetria terragena]